MEKVLNNLRRECEERGLKLSITERGKEGKSKAIAPCGYLEEKFQDCSKKRSGSSVQCGNIRSGSENDNQEAGCEGEDEVQKVRCEVLHRQKEPSFSEDVLEDSCEEVVEDATGPCEAFRLQNGSS